MNLTKRQLRATFPTTTNFTDGKPSGMRRKHAWERPSPEGWVFEEDKARAKFGDAAVMGGVVRWNSNGSVPPADCLGDWHDLGLIGDEELEMSTAAREADTAKLLESYRKRNANRKLSAEERFELRANHGPGTTLVNVITGRRWTV